MNEYTRQTRHEAYEEVLETLTSRQQQVLEELALAGDVTANELAMIFLQKGLTPLFSRNYVHPRLNELFADEKVTIVGKRKCSITNRNCAVYRIVQ